MASSQKTYVSYIRVSTRRQGESGLGLEAQRAASKAFLRPGDVIAAEYVEVESGRKSDRPELARALDHARRIGAVLLIAKLDRLARNVAFISNLMEAGVEITAADMPEANRVMLHVMAAMAEHEAQAISERTVAALAAAKARGVKLGWANPKRGDQKAAGAASGRARRDQALAFAQLHGPRVMMRRAEGASLAQIAEEFNHQKIASSRGGKWHASSVRNLCRIYERTVCEPSQGGRSLAAR